MKILITGHKGFIGSNLLSALKKRGHYCWTMEMNDDFDELKLESIISRCDVIFHVGAISDTTLQDANKMLYYNYTIRFKMSKKYQVLEEKEDLSYKNINKKLRRLYLLHKNDKTALRFIKNYIENELPSMIKKQISK